MVELRLIGVLYSSILYLWPAASLLSFWTSRFRNLYIYVHRPLRLILDVNDPDPAFVAFSSSDEYILLVKTVGHTTTLEMYAIADETFLRLSKIPPIPLNSPWILTNFVKNLATKFGMKSSSRVFVGAFWVMGFLNQPGFSLTLLNLTDVLDETAEVVVTKPIDG